MKVDISHSAELKSSPQSAHLPTKPATKLHLLYPHHPLLSPLHSALFPQSIHLPSPRIPRPHPLVERNPHRIHGTDPPIKRRLEISMRAQTLLDEPAPPTLGPQPKRLEPVDVFGVEEHVAHGNELLVDFVRVSRQDDSFRDDAVGVRGKGCACRYER